MISASLGVLGSGKCSVSFQYQKEIKTASACHCMVCGIVFYARSSKGRKPHFCSDNCRDLQKFFDAFKDRLGKVKLSPAAVKSMRGELFVVANSLCGGGQ